MRGGRVGARALVRQLALRADDALRAEAAALVAGRDPAAIPVRSAFAEELAAIPAADPAADRELATGALRSLLRERGPKDVRTRQRPRADPLLRADLPPVPPAPADQVPLIVADAEPGAVALHDAVVLDHGLLVATGAHGLQLLALDGRPRGRWDIAADALCVSDHGDRVLAIGHGESIAELHGFDLATRRARRRGMLRRAYFVDSYDGATVTVLDRTAWPTSMSRARSRASCGASSTATRWCSSWRARRGRWRRSSTPRCKAEAASAASSCGCGSCRPGPLARRELAEGRWDREAVTTASGTLLWVAGDREVRREHGHVATAAAPEGARHMVSGDVDGLVDPDGPRVTLRRDGHPGAVVELPTAQTLRVRAHADVACAWAPDGRVVAVDLATRAAVANVTVRMGA